MAADAPPSAYRLIAFDNAQQTSEQIDPLAYEKQPAVKRCGFTRTGDGRDPNAADRDATSDTPHPQVKILNVHVTVFFDGTNNNMLRDAGSPTNVVRLFDLHRVGYSPPVQTVDGIMQTLYGALYVRGPGSFDDHAWSKDLGERVKLAETNAAQRVQGLSAKTPQGPAAPGSEDDLPDKAKAPTWWGRRKEGLKETASSAGAGQQDMRGNGSGFGMVDRIVKAYDWVRGQAANANPPDLATFRVNAVGFSRGAATARSFWNNYQAWMTREGVIRRLKQPARFGFLGLFDTVASIGVHPGSGDTANHNIRLDGNRDTDVTHLVAQDEFRWCFRYNPCGVEEWLTGAHSDVGGGYGTSGDDGAERSNTLAYIGLARMYDAAYRSGLPLNPLGADVRGQAARLDAAASHFRANYRERLWTMARDMNADRVHPYVSEADARAWWNGRRRTSAYAPDNQKSEEDWLQLRQAFLFWRNWIHLSYVADGSGGPGREADVGTTGMGVDSRAWPGFKRAAAEPETRVPLSGYPDFEWEAP